MYEKKVTLLDGAVGTSLWEKTDHKVPVWRYNVENPGIVTQLHQEYVAAGAEIILANTFGANAGNVKTSDYTVQQIVMNAMKIAKSAVAGKARIALAVGPLSGLLEPYGDISADSAFQMFDEQIGYGVEGGPDLIFIQTFTDLEMLKIALKVANQHNLPVFASMSFDQTGHTMMGNSVQELLHGLKGFRVDAVGLNCSLGPRAALPVIEEFNRNTDLPLLFKPNAGKSSYVNGKTVYESDIETFSKEALPALNCGVRYIGGCCGTNAAYIRRLREGLVQLQGNRENRVQTKAVSIEMG